MSETVLAAMIAAGATILTTLLQLKISLSRDGGATPRTPNSSRKKPKLPAMLLAVMLTAAAVGGFALSQWFSERERVQQHELRQELQARITEISRTAGELRQSKLDTFAEVEVDVLRRMGGSGIVALATVGPCHGTLVSTASSTPAGNLSTAGALPRGSMSTPGTAPAFSSAGGSATVLGSAAKGSAPVSTSANSVSGGSAAVLNPASVAAAGLGSTIPAAAATSSSTPSTALMAGSAVAAAMGGVVSEPAAAANNATATLNDSTAASAQAATPDSACAEADATPVLLCAPIPSNAVVSHVDLFTRFADGNEPWNASQVSAGQEVGQARFSEKKLESLADDGMKHVCHKFANWSTQHARVARMIVRYAIPAEALEPQSQVSHKAVVGSTRALAVR